MRYYFTFIFLLSLFTGNKIAYSQIYGDSLFAAGNYDLAALAFYEEYYFEENPDFKANFLLKRVNSLKQIGEFTKAADELDKFNFNCTNELKYKLKFEAALCYYLAGDFLLSNLQLQWIDRLYASQSNNKDCLRLKVIILAQLENYEELEKLVNEERFKVFFNADLMQNWFVEYKTRKVKKENTAEWFSSFVPGWGQTYAGYFGEGVSGFILNAAALGFMGYNFWLTNYITTFTVGSGLLNKFYFGSRRRSVHLVKSRNYQLKQQYLLKLLELTT